MNTLMKKANKGGAVSAGFPLRPILDALAPRCLSAIVKPLSDVA